jgi:hypothetical protein
MSRAGFDVMLTVFGSILPKGHILPKNMYESQKLLRALKMPYEPIHACEHRCILFREEHAEATHCPKCGSSRFVEQHHGDGRIEQLSIPVKILRYLPVIPRLPTIHDRGVCETDDMAQTWTSIQS